MYIRVTNSSSIAGRIYRLNTNSMINSPRKANEI